MSKTVGVVLSGCGVFDGAEIREAVFTLLALDLAGAKVIFMAPNVPQMHVIDHLKGAPEEGKGRNVLVESARIARGDIRDVATVNSAEIDALIFPGGFGAAKNLCSFAVDGAECAANPDVAKLINAMRDAGKPLGFICIAPALAAKVIGGGVELTIGDDADTAAALEKMGAKHFNHPVTEIHVDKARKVVSVGAYMFGDARPSEVNEGITKLVDRVLEMA